MTATTGLTKSDRRVLYWADGWSKSDSSCYGCQQRCDFVIKTRYSLSRCFWGSLFVNPLFSRSLFVIVVRKLMLAWRLWKNNVSFKIVIQKYVLAVEYSLFTVLGIVRFFKMNKFCHKLGFPKPSTLYPIFVFLKTFFKDVFSMRHFSNLLSSKPPPLKFY